jgi:glycosyltransferase involved in cell wall biosynthesis
MATQTQGLVWLYGTKLTLPLSHATYATATRPIIRFHARPRSSNEAVNLWSIAFDRFQRIQCRRSVMRSRRKKPLTRQCWDIILTVKHRVVVVMPAYNAARTLERTYADLPGGVVDKVILVDDVSQDETVEVARQLGLTVVIHVQNRGYGGNQKTCYLEALKDGADIVVMLHPDYQYDSRRVPALIAPIISGDADLVLGSRLLDGGALAGGMPLYKYLSNRFLTIVENLAFGQNLSECHTGFRAYSRHLLTTIPFVLNSDKFVFDTEVIAQTVAFGFKISEVPVPTRYFKEASSVNFTNSVIYGAATLRVVLRFLLDRAKVQQSPQFRRRLGEVVSRYHLDQINGGAGSQRSETSIRDEGRSPTT